MFLYDDGLLRRDVSCCGSRRGRAWAPPAAVAARAPLQLLSLPRSGPANLIRIVTFTARIGKTLHRTPPAGVAWAEASRFLASGALFHLYVSLDRQKNTFQPPQASAVAVESTAVSPQAAASSDSTLRSQTFPAAWSAPQAAEGSDPDVSPLRSPQMWHVAARGRQPSLILLIVLAAALTFQHVAGAREPGGLRR